MTAKLAEIEVGQTARVELNGEWYGATVVSVHPEEGKTNWITVSLQEYTEAAPKGVMIQGFNDTKFTDFDGEVVHPTIEIGSVLVMRSDKGKLGTDTTSVGSGSTIEKAVEDTLEHFKTDCAEFKETPEAMKSILEKGVWRSEDRKIQYYLKF